MKFKHCFDLGVFILIKLNEDGTGTFIKEPNFFEEYGSIAKTIEYVFKPSEMKRIN